MDYQACPNMRLVFLWFEESNSSIFWSLDNWEIVDVFFDIVRILYACLKFKIEINLEESNVP